MASARPGPIARLVQDAAREDAEGWLRTALGDPTLELIRVNHDGELIAPVIDDSARTVTPIGYGERTVGLLVHDAAAAAQPAFGEIVAAIGVVIEREWIAEALQRQRDLLSAIGDGTPALLCVLFEDGTIPEEGMNRAGRELIGETHESLHGRCFWETVVAPDDADEVRRRVMRIVAGEAVPEHIARWRTPAGEALVAWTGATLPVVGPRPVFLISGVDVTERERRAQELRESRARLVAAADDERRRLERNLHDGAQQRLVTVSLSLRLAGAAIATEPDRAAEMLNTASDQLTEAIAELRELARGLHPAILTDRGLGPALLALARRSAIPVTIANEVDRRLPESVEIAIYFVVSEALTNAAKHAQASEINVTLGVVDGVLAVTITDNGVGGADLANGTGLRGLSDRMEAIAGRLTVESGERGTTLVASAPVTS